MLRQIPVFHKFSRAGAESRLHKAETRTVVTRAWAGHGGRGGERTVNSAGVPLERRSSFPRSVAQWVTVIDD